MDLVFPKGNEKELALAARKLGIKDLILCYNEHKDIPKTLILELKKPQAKSAAFAKEPKAAFPNISTALIVQNRNTLSQLKKHADLLIGSATREFFEEKKIDAIMGFGLEQKKDHTHYRKSLTQVEATLAKDKILFYSLQDYHQSTRKEELLGRWMQDKRTLAKKHVLTVVVSGAKTPFDLRSDKDRQAVWDAL